MIVHTVDDLGNRIVQLGRVWWSLKLGKPSASNAGRVMTPKSREYSAGAHPYIAELIAEQMIGQPVSEDEDAEEGGGNTLWTERGIVGEAQARAWYSMETGREVAEVACVEADDHSEICSPDGLVGDDGIVEIKVRSAKHHMMRVLGLESVAPYIQVQAILRLTGRAWCDSVAWNPTLPCVIERVYRDEPYIADLGKCMDQFKAEMAKGKERLQAIGRVRVDDGLLALLAASVRKKKSGAMSDDEIREMHDLCQTAQAKGILDDKDVMAIIADIQADRWDDVRNMRDHIHRSFKLEVVG